MPPKNSLGRGLGAMFPDLLNNIGDRPAFVQCGIEELTPNRFQPRRDFNDEDQKELVTSVKKSGIIQPIIVRKADSGYEIIAGERRWRAAQAAGLKEVPIIIRKAEDQELAELSLIENIQREALNPMEEADAYQTLLTRFSLSQEEISTRVGKDRSTIANTVRLLKLPEAAKKALIGKQITAGHARALLALLGGDTLRQGVPTIISALKIIRQKDLNVRDTERLIRNLKKAPEKKKTGLPDPYLTDLERELSSQLLAAVQIRAGKRSGTIEIRYTNGEELNRLVRLLLEGK
ncbi:MAG: ParB/RepB/Spo0J family partition protein [Deltaproteobacteria bacterium]|nr:ParB/RepB/Spo0J family partition protein [Deltaproteobacteria bacterium]